MPDWPPHEPDAFVCDEPEQAWMADQADLERDRLNAEADEDEEAQ